MSEEPSVSSSQKSSKGFLSGCLVSIAVLTCVVALAIVCIIAIFGALGQKFSSEEFASTLKEKSNMTESLLYGNSRNNETIAVIDVNGVITSGDSSSDNAGCDTIVRLLEYAANRHDISAIILRVDSPGGEVTASDIIYDAVERIREKARKPVVVMMGTLAASGGYYISSHADWIVANPTTWTGSIGVIISGFNVEEGMNKLGIRNQVFTSGAFKDMLSPMRAMSTSEKEYVQSMVNSTYDRFVNIVSTGRKIPREKLEAEHAIDGRILTGVDAKQLGLVDQLGYFRDAIAKASDLAGTNDPKVILLEEKTGFAEFLSLLSMEAKTNKNISVNIGNASLPKLRPGIPYMLPTHYATGALVSEQ